MSQQLEAKSNNITVNGTQDPGCQVKLEITVTPTAATAAYSKAIKSVNKGVSLPGFRKGKAPESLILQGYKKHVDQEWEDLLLNTAFQEALDLIKVYPFSQKTIKKAKVNKASKEEGADITIEYESSPEIPELAFDKIELNKVEPEKITDENIDQTIEDIRYYHATWEDITDRAIQEGDYVDVDIEALEDPPHTICTDSRFAVEKGKMGDWMLKLLIGKKTGESVEGMSEKDPKSKAKEFKPTLCKITVKGVKKPTMPELDDELAKKAGGENVEDLRVKIKEDLERRTEQEAQDKLRQQVEDYLFEHCPFEVPASITSGEIEVRMNSRVSTLKEQGKTDEEIEKIRDTMEEEVTKEVERAIRITFLTQSIAQENKIDVSDEEVMQELIREMYLHGNLDLGNSEQARSRAFLTLQARKVKDFLIEKAKIS